MHDSISENAEFNFNYVCLLIVASIVAALGLMTNSSTTVISSMLLSPIMGPVIGMSYGLVIWDIDLIKKSAKVELYIDHHLHPLWLYPHDLRQLDPGSRWMGDG